MTQEKSELSGFSRIITREDVPVAGLKYTLTANEHVRELLRERFDLVSLDSLIAEVEILPFRKTGLRVTGSFSAAVVQACIVTLEPVESALAEEFTLDFRPVVVADGSAREVAVDPMAEEAPEPLLEEGFDLGEVVAEQLALAIEPYPRAPGAELNSDVGSDEVLEKKPNPFSVLKNLKIDDKD